MQAVDKHSIDYAFDRLKAFSLVNQTREHENKVDGLINYCESVGMDEDTIEYLYTLCEQYFIDGLETASCAFIGSLLGLAIVENLTDRTPCD